MEKEKLELKHLAPYLPYGLKCEVELTDNSELPWYFSDDEIYKLDGLMLDWMSSDEVLSVKPILRPLSDLSKAEELEVFGYEDEDDTGIMWLEGVHAVFSKFDYTVDIYNKLLEKHFDLFGLIPKGLAIDINTLM